MHADIDIVHVIFKTHLDVGFTDTARAVVERYMTRFIPDAIALAETMQREYPEEPFRWTAGAWLFYEYLEQASAEQRRSLERAVSKNLVAWHAAPFTTHTELMDERLLRYGLSLSQKLDQRFGKRTIAAKMTDVPGHTRALIPLFSEAGIRFFHLGVNLASTVPEVPPVFRWRDTATSTDVLMMYQHGYGDVMLLPGTKEALALIFTGDNHGPPSLEYVHQTYAELRQLFPNATFTGSTLDAAAESIERANTPLPLITDEIGDTWIHGIGTDPTKVSQYRELLRLRDEWINTGRIDEAQLDRFHHALLMIPEHTWGMDRKTYLQDHEHYDTRALALMRGDPMFRHFEGSWSEQRGYLTLALTALDGTPLRAEADDRLRETAPRRADLSAYRPLDEARLETAYWNVGLHRADGSIYQLTHISDGSQWADHAHPIGRVIYEAFSAHDYGRFWKQYIRNKDHQDIQEWAFADFTKPGLQAEAHCAWLPQAQSILTRVSDRGTHLLIEAGFPWECREIGAPDLLTLEYVFATDGSIEIDLQWFGKPACRLPEAFWLSIQPIVSGEGRWAIHKLGGAVDPTEVVRGGARTLHGVNPSVTYQDRTVSLEIESLDAVLVAPGRRSLLDFHNQPPDMTGGVHFNLYNNVWGTNFPMWFEDDARFRFVLRLQKTD